MNREVVELREVINKLVPLLAGKHIKVTQRGVEARVTIDPKTKRPKEVNIPSIPDNATPEFVRAIQGFVDGEVGHVLVTDFSVQENYRRVEKDATKMKRVCGMHEIVEDTFVERSMIKIYPGSQRHVSELRRYFLEKITKPALKSAKSEKESFSYLFVPLVRALAGQREFDDFMTDNNHYQHPLVQEFIKKLPADLKKALPMLGSTRHTLQAAQVFDKILYEVEPEDQEEKEDEEDTQAKGKGKKEHEKNSSKASGGQQGAGDAEDDGDEGGQSGGKGKGKKSKSQKPQKPEKSEKSEDEANPAAEDDKSEDAGEDQSDDDADDKSDDEGQDEAEDGKGSEDEDGEDADDADDADDGDGDDDADEGDDDGAGGSSDDDEEDEDEDEDEDQSSMSYAVNDGEHEADGGDAGDEKSDGGGVGSGAGKSVFDLDDDAFEKADLGRQISIHLTKNAIETMNKSDYKVFSREDDTIKPLDVPANLPATYIPALDEECIRMVGKLQKDIERMMAAQSLSVRVPGHRSGRLHSASLHRMMAADDRVFNRKHEHRTKATAVTLLVDNSGSMMGEKLRVAMVAAYALAMTMERVGIPCELIGFTTGGYSSAYTKMSDEDRKVQYNRTVSINMPIYKGFDERVNSTVKGRIAHMANNQPGCNTNVDGECLEYAAVRLLKRKEPRKVMLVLSDGQPAGASNAAAHLKTVVGDLVKNGIDIAGIGIQDDSVRHFYPKHMVLHNVEDLPGIVMGELKRVLTS